MRPLYLSLITASSNSILHLPSRATQRVESLAAATQCTMVGHNVTDFPNIVLNAAAGLSCH